MVKNNNKLTKGCASSKTKNFANRTGSNSKTKSFAKLGGLLGLMVIVVLCMAMVLQAPHIGTLLNQRVVSQSFDDVVKSTQGKDTRAEDFKIPTGWWLDNIDVGDFDAGDGSVESPWQMSTSSQLALMASKINNEGGHWLTDNYQLTRDVDMSMYYWSPMGTWAGDRAFRGSLNGGSYEMGDDGKLHGVVHTISSLIMKNKESVDNGSTVGFFGLLGDQAVITNLIIDNSIGYIDYELDLDSDSERVTLAVVASQVKSDANVLFQNMAVLNSGVFAPQTLTEDGSDGIDFIHVEVKAGVYVGWQQGRGVDDLSEGRTPSGFIYMNEAHARLSSVIINIYLDLSGWDMSPDIVVNSFGGLIGEAGQVDIQNSSFEGIVGVEVVRRDRNMDNAQFIYNAGGAIGMLAGYRESTSHLSGLDLSGTIYLDTFKNEDDGFNRNVAQAYSSKAVRDIPWSADVRQIGAIIGDTNIAEPGNIEISDTKASFFVDAPKGNNISLGDKQEVLPFSIQVSPQSQSTQVDTQSEVSQVDAQSTQSSTLNNDESISQDNNQVFLQQSQSTQVEYGSQSDFSKSRGMGRFFDASGSDDSKFKQAAKVATDYSQKNKQVTMQREFKTHVDKSAKNSDTSTRGSIEGPPTAPAGPIVLAMAAPAIIFGLTYLAVLAAGGSLAVYMAWTFVFITYLVAEIAIVLFIFVAVIVIVAVVVFAVLFAFWGGMKPKWESQVFVGGAIGSEGRGGITLNNVHTANDVIASDTMFSKNDGAINKIDSHNTTPTLGMFTKQPESPKSSDIGDKVHLEVAGKGTIMSDGSKGVDSNLEYQWYYNTIDSNIILDGTEPNMGGAKTVKVEGATDPSLDLIIDWAGSRYYFVKQINHVIEFWGNIHSVTARVGKKQASVKPAEITQQPKGMSINVGTADNTLNVVAQATGDIDYQWYFNTTPSTDGAILLSGGNKSEFVPILSKSGTYYYYVVVTVSVKVVNSDEFVRADTISRFAQVDALAVANDIKITVQPDSKKTVEKNMNTILGVAVDLRDVNGTLSYQWYKANYLVVEGTAMEGETYQSLVVDTSKSDTTSYYYVVVSNTVENSVKSVKSEVSTIIVSSEVALKINTEDLRPLEGIAGTPMVLSVFATAEEGGSLHYQWYNVQTSGNTNGDIMEGITSPTLSLYQTQASIEYYYVEMYTIKPNGEVSQRQRSNTVSVEFKDPDQYKFDQFKNKLESTKITSQKYNANGLLLDNVNGSDVASSNTDTQAMSSEKVDLHSTDVDAVVLQVDIDTSEIVGDISYQWYISDNADGSDATAIPGAIGTSWRISRDSARGQKYYFVNIINTAQVYSPTLGKYTAIYSSTNLTPVSILHPDYDKDGTMTSVVLFASIVVLLGMMAVLTIYLVHKKQKAKSMQSAEFRMQNKGRPISMRNDAKMHNVLSMHNASSTQNSQHTMQNSNMSKPMHNALIMKNESENELMLNSKFRHD